jgi:hypothetical protein
MSQETIKEANVLTRALYFCSGEHIQPEVLFFKALSLLGFEAHHANNQSASENCPHFFSLLFLVYVFSAHSAPFENKIGERDPRFKEIASD